MLKAEFESIYPYSHPKDTRIIATMHVYIPELKLDLRGIAICWTKARGVYAQMPFFSAIDEDSGNKIRYPFFSFIDIEENKAFLNQLTQLAKENIDLKKIKKKPKTKTEE